MDARPRAERLGAVGKKPHPTIRAQPPLRLRAYVERRVAVEEQPAAAALLLGKRGTVLGRGEGLSERRLWRNRRLERRVRHVVSFGKASGCSAFTVPLRRLICVKHF